jgi:cell division protein FtsA
VIEAAQTFPLPPNGEIIEVFPREFIVDGEKGVMEPLAMKGVRLEAETLILGCFSPYLKYLTKAVLAADVQIADIVISPLASAEALLSPREKELGVILIDIGAGTTGFAIYNEGILINAGVVPIGSGHITSDIAVGLKTDVSTAEKVKLQYGSCFLKRDKKIKVKQLISGNSLDFSLKFLGKIIDARAAEIFDQIQKELKKSKLDKLPGGVILTGGGVKLPKMEEMAKKRLGLFSRQGAPENFFTLEKDPRLSCLAGLVLCGKSSAGSERINGAKDLWNKFKGLLRNFIP